MTQRVKGEIRLKLPSASTFVLLNEAITSTFFTVSLCCLHVHCLGYANQDNKRFTSLDFEVDAVLALFVLNALAD